MSDSVKVNLAEVEDLAPGYGMSEFGVSHVATRGSGGP